MKPTMTIDEYGTKEWKLNGVYHRDDGPAVEEKNGTKAWLINGIYHREDGPAVEWEDGQKDWYINDEYINLEDIINNNPEGYGPWTASDLIKLKFKYL